MEESELRESTSRETPREPRTQFTQTRKLSSPVALSRFVALSFEWSRLRDGMKADRFLSPLSFSQSPALLQLSGVGPISLLSSVGVDTVIDLPGVGKNLNEVRRLLFSMRLLFSSLSDQNCSRFSHQQTSNVIGYTPSSGVGFGGTGPSDTIAFPSFNQVRSFRSAERFALVLFSL